MRTLDSAMGSGSLAESTSLNVEVRSSDASTATVCTFPKMEAGLRCITFSHYNYWEVIVFGP